MCTKIASRSLITFLLFHNLAFSQNSSDIDRNGILDLEEHLYPATPIVVTEQDYIEVMGAGYGEAYTRADLNLDGIEEFVLLPASRREELEPEFNEVLFLNIDDNLQIDQVTDIRSSENKAFLTGWAQDAGAADFNSDGLMDVWISGHGRECCNDERPNDLNYVILAGSDGHVQKIVTEEIREYAFWHSSRIADYDLDGDPDVVVLDKTLSSEYQVALLKNDGQANFSRVPLPWDVEMGHFYQGWIVADGHATPGSRYDGQTTFFSALTVEFADVNGDNYPDLLVGSGQAPGEADTTPRAVRVYINENGDFPIDSSGNYLGQTFDIPWPDLDFPLTFSDEDKDLDRYATDKINSADFNNDGYDDLILKISDNYTTNWLLLLKNNADGSFEEIKLDTSNSIDYGFDQGDFEDFNGDGYLDVFAHIGQIGDIHNINDYIWLNAGDSQFLKLSDIQDVTYDMQAIYGDPGINYELDFWRVVNRDDGQFFLLQHPTQFITSAERYERTITASINIQDWNIFNHRLIGSEFSDNIVVPSDVSEIYAGMGNDTITASSSGNFVHGGIGDDIVYSGIGPDSFEGGEGSDTIVYPNTRSSYRIEQEPNLSRFRVTPLTSSDTPDSIFNVETIRFSDESLALTSNGEFTELAIADRQRISAFASNKLVIPQVLVGSDVFYLELTLIDQENLSFQVTAADDVELNSDLPVAEFSKNMLIVDSVTVGAISYAVVLEVENAEALILTLKEAIPS